MAFHLFAAEVDQIQDFVFRASRLREVVGGSQLLSRFCKGGAEALLRKHGGESAQVIVNDGGAFRIIFQNENDAKDFGRDLAELYRRCAGASLTVALPVSYNDLSEFESANIEAHRRLRTAKSRGDSAAVPVHIPYIAFCASCGVGIAAEWHERHPGQRANYRCAVCRLKEKERDEEKREMQRRNEGKAVSHHLKQGGEEEGFLARFLRAVKNECGIKDSEAFEYEFPEDADAVAQFDLTGRRYVAYLIADGNGTGRLFRKCKDPKEMNRLSEALPEAMRESLASAFPALRERISKKNEQLEKEGKKKVLPVLPLILGGDDLFALLPASWAIDYASRFCQEYERRLKENLAFIEGETPTIAAAVVICKTSYPHTLAHRHGKVLLDEAKELARHLEAQAPDKRELVSVLNFDLITGNEVGAQPVSDNRLFRATARPYFVKSDLSENLRRTGLSIQSLLDHRLAISRAELPAKRRAEFEKLYHEAERVESKELITIRPFFEELLNRIGTPESKVRRAVTQAMTEMCGQITESNLYWGKFGNRFNGHGFADLLDVWDYAYDVTKEVSKYGEYQK